MARRDPVARRRNHCFDNAKDYARSERYDMMLAWLGHAVKHRPLTAMQLYGIGQILGPYKYAEFNIDRYGKPNR